MTCRDRIETYLQEQRVTYVTHHHTPAFTAQGVAEHEHIPHRYMIKVVIVFADGQMVMLAIPASERVDLAKVSALVAAHDVRLATEEELASAFPDCKIGAMPPFGLLYDLPLYVDRALATDEVVFFQAGTHSVAMSLLFADYKRLARPIIADLTREYSRPAPLEHADVHEMGAW
ncbi:MAG: YbaK/EbsC family protein [Oscillochloris sp.]|nr:YbaK/EbsC family protein [Oscillochloris sp.]